MKSESKMAVQGRVRITEIYIPVRDPLDRWQHRNAVKGGSARVILETSNIVTDRGLQVLAALLAGGLGVHSIGGSGYGPSNFDTLRVNSLRITDAVAPPSELPSDTALTGTPVYDFRDDYPTNGDQLMTSVQLGTPGEVQFSGLVQPQDIPGTILTEEGLFTESGVLVARTTFTYTKSNNVAVQFDHVISIARV